MKARPCTLIVNTANGYCMTPEKHPSIKKAIQAAKESCGFAYRIYVGRNLVARGFCD